MTAERLHKALVKRYNLEPLLPKGLKVKLPHSKEEVMLAVHCAKAAVGNLLADPRFDDDSFLWFDNDPLAGPPEIWSEIGDVNISNACQETHKALMTPRPHNNCGRRRVLCPFIFYLDGCVTGQYQNHAIEILKFTLGMFKGNIRNKKWASRNLETVKRAMDQQKEQGRTEHP